MSRIEKGSYWLETISLEGVYNQSATRFKKVWDAGYPSNSPANSSSRWASSDSEAALRLLTRIRCLSDLTFADDSSADPITNKVQSL
jgi:hypothetical protein